MNPSAAAATPAPLEDIAGPVAYFPYPIWLIAAVVAGALVLISFLVWFFLIRKPRRRPLTPRERARAELSLAREQADQVKPYELGIRVSDTLRVLIEAETGLRATRQTSIEFLQEIRGSDVFSIDQKAAIALFLENADLIKFARAHATSDDSRELIVHAEHIVEATPNVMESTRPPSVDPEGKK